MNVTIILGTRPELIKFTPIIEALQRKPSVTLTVVNTRQHTELLDTLSHESFQETVMYWPLGSTNGPLNWKLSHMVQQLDFILPLHKPDLVLVQGDTTTALAGALTASNLQIKVGHVEAGLRTYDKSSPFPEENNRRQISSLADYHFCISELSKRNLNGECVEGDKWVTGSTAIDMVKRIPYTLAGPRKYILLTLHRRENLESGKAEAYVASVMRFLRQHEALNGLHNVTCLWVTHPNPKVQELVKKVAPNRPAGMGMVEAANYTRFIEYAQHAWAICSDSGGIQEENTVLRRPLFILRDTTERPEVLVKPNAALVHKPEMLCEWLQDLYLHPELYAALPGEDTTYGVGDAGQQIADIIGDFSANS